MHKVFSYDMGDSQFKLNHESNVSCTTQSFYMLTKIIRLKWQIVQFYGYTYKMCSMLTLANQISKQANDYFTKFQSTIMLISLSPSLLLIKRIQ